MAFQPGLPGSQFPGEDYLVRRIQDLERAVQQLAAANPFAPMGITPTPNGFTVTGTETVNGSLTVNGPAAITGTLSLPAGIIGNDALANPISATTSHIDTDNFALSTGANVEKVRATFIVPAGFTRALVYATATMGGNNTSASTDNMYLSCTINGSGPGWSSKTAVVNGFSGDVANAATALLTGLGSTFYVSGKASSGVNAWPAPGAGNGTHMNLDVMVIYLR